LAIAAAAVLITAWTVHHATLKGGGGDIHDRPPGPLDRLHHRIP